MQQIENKQQESRITSTALIITLNVNGLKITTKRNCQVE